MLHIHRSTFVTFFGLFFFLALLVSPGNTALYAQYGQTARDGHTPTDLQQGAPAGSYSLSGFENINHYNGSMNIALPLINLNGCNSFPGSSCLAFS